MRSQFQPARVPTVAARIALSISSLCLGVLVVTTASAQVPSHTPTTVEPPLAASVSIQPTGRVVARVNGSILTDRDLLREMYTIFPYARVHNGFPQAMEAGIRDGAMKMMIFEELVYQEAKRRGATVPPAALSHELAAFRQQFSSSQAFDQFMQTEFHGSQALLRTKVERSLLIDRYLKSEVSEKSAVSANEAKTYFDQHRDKFLSPDSYSFQSISILPPAGGAADGRKRAEDALRRAKATKSYEEFGLLAEKTSEDDFRVMMGAHKNADRSKLPPAVVKALASMQPGQVSDVVEFDTNAYTILRLEAHVPAGTQKFDTIKDLLRAQLEKTKTEQLRSALATKLSKNATIEKL